MYENTLECDKRGNIRRMIPLVVTDFAQAKKKKDNVWERVCNMRETVQCMRYGKDVP